MRIRALTDHDVQARVVLEPATPLSQSVSDLRPEALRPRLTAGLPFTGFQ
jgi:hypothetical protein